MRGFPRIIARTLIETLALGLFAFPLLASSSSGEPSPTEGKEPVELRLLRTIFVGVPQDIELEKIREIALPNSDSTSYYLAKAALRVLGHQEGKPRLGALLGRLLEQLHLQGDDLLPESLPRGFGSDDLIYTLVRALAVSGGLDEAEQVLIREIDIGSQHKKHVILEALHQLGSRNAKATIQKASELSDLWFLASNLLTDYRSPTLFELAQHWGAIPPNQRKRTRLLQIAQQGCSNPGPAMLAIHLLGYLAPHPAKHIESREIGLLRTSASEASCSNGRLFAAQALALRSPELPLVWRQAVDRAQSAWERRQLIRAFWVRQPQALAVEALARLEKEPTQLVQWELMWGLVHYEQGVAFRDLWGLWFLSPHLQFRLENSRRFDVLNPAAIHRILDWLEQGHRPADDRVLEWLLVSLVRGARGPQVPRVLTYIDQRAKLPAEMNWIYTELSDPSALPWLRRRLEASDDEDFKRALEQTIQSLEEQAAVTDNQ